MTFRVESLPGNYNFGAVICDLKPADLDSPDVRKALYDTWIDKGLLVFKNMAGGRETQLKLSLVFGELEIHPLPSARLPEAQELTALIYKPGDGAVVMVDNEPRGAYLHWHSDLIYVDRINRGGLLRAIQIPAHGGYTGFIDQIGLYTTLPEDLKARIEGLNVIYQYNPAYKKFGKQTELLRGGEKMAAVKPENYSYVAHPMVFTQTETGRKVLNVSPWFALGIEGKENAEGDALLARIIDHCEDSSGAYYHHWQQDDMVLWDNWRMLHGCYGVPQEESRRVERTTIKGDYQLGRVVRGGQAFTEQQRVSI